MLPSEDGTSSDTSSWMSGIFDAARTAAAAANEVAVEYASFTKFQARVDELIRDLKGSPAGPDKLGQEQLVRHQLGGGEGAWAEAAGLYGAYETVITELETLSKLLSDSMEGMSIAVLASHKGYQNIDTDVRDRMVAISAETTKHYGGGYDPEVARTGNPHGGGTPKAPSGGDAGGSI
ncbi:hypothetical protein [Streptomyces sp. YU58]|uniref:hypothetical protein n=1 Tax=Streptomyces sp. SX92 TaxID=3158972 RepID=UPI0027B8D80A|nr:hypothetical protein [Streptomyces coralus]WLW53570.1 hypothetical protein QU709_20305 [Streptomyces coralus]